MGKYKSLLSSKPWCIIFFPSPLFLFLLFGLFVCVRSYYIAKTGLELSFPLPPLQSTGDSWGDITTPTPQSLSVY